MASAQAEIMKDKLREFAEELSHAGDLTLAEVRANGERFAQFTAEPAGVTWTEVDAGGIPAVWADTQEGAGDRVLQYVHGGGYMIGSAAGYRNFTGHLARAVGCRVLNVDYGLAPSASLWICWAWSASTKSLWHEAFCASACTDLRVFEARR